MPLAPGTRIDSYEITARIGAGGMGEVYRARDVRLNRDVALKVLPSVFAADPDRMRRFKTEAQAIAALNHPNICQIYDVGPDYLVLEYIDGAPLIGPLAADEAVPLALQIVSALESAHRRGMIHRDLKPANILVMKNGTAKLLDFGLAKLMTSDPDVTATAEGLVMGTTAYMSPEQAQGKPLDERSDMFSFGSVLYELLSGDRAFIGSSTVDVLSAILRDEPRPLDGAPQLVALVARCLNKAPAERFQTMAEVRLALEAIREKPESGAPSIAVLPFSNMSADKENEYFSDGLTEEIITALTQIPGLNVTARTSSFAFRGKEQDIRRIAQTLNVQTVLEGSVRRAGQRIRVTAQLIDSVNGYHLWSERYDRELADVFAIQDEIAQAIANALKIRLSSKSSATARKYTPVLQAYEALLKARHVARKFSAESLATTKQYLEEAIRLDPGFALSHAEMGMYFVGLSGLQMMPAREAMMHARAASEKALRIDPAQPLAHCVLAIASLFRDHDWKTGGLHFQAAMVRPPVPPDVYHYYGFFYLLPLGRIAEAAKFLERALSDDPLNVLCRTQLAVCYWMLDRHDDAKRTLREALALDENFWLAVFVQGVLISLEENRLDEALRLAEQGYRLNPRSAQSIGLLAALLWRAGHRERSDDLIRQLGDGSAYGAALGLSSYNVHRSDLRKAAEWAEIAIEQRDPNTLPALCGPFRELFEEAGCWAKLARLLNLPEDTV